MAISSIIYIPPNWAPRRFYGEDRRIIKNICSETETEVTLNEQDYTLTIRGRDREDVQAASRQLHLLFEGGEPQKSQNPWPRPDRHSKWGRPRDLAPGANPIPKGLRALVAGMGATPVPHARTIRGGTSDDGRDSDGELGSGSDGNMRLQKAMEFQSDVKRQIEAVADADQRIRQKLEEIQRDTGTRCLYHKEKGAVLITANSVEHLEGAEYRIRQFENFILTRWPQPPPNPSGLSESASSFPPPPRPRPPSPSPTPAPLVHKRRFESDTSEYAKRARGIDGVIKIESAVPETPPPPPPPHQYTNLMDFAMALTLGTYRPDVEQIMQSDGEPPSGRHGTVSREVRSQAPTVVSMDKRPLPAASRSSSSPMTGLEQIVQSDGEEEDVPLDDPVARRRAARMEVCIHPPSMSVLEDRAGPFGKNGTASGEVRLLTPTVASMDKRPTPAALPSWSPITGLDPQEHFIQFPDDW